MNCLSFLFNDICAYFLCINIYFTSYLCFCRAESWKSPSVVYFLVLQLSIVAVALVDLYGNRFGLFSSCDSCWGQFLSTVERLVCK